MLAVDLRKLFWRERVLGFGVLSHKTVFVSKEKESVFFKIKKGKHFSPLMF